MPFAGKHSKSFYLKMNMNEKHHGSLVQYVNDVIAMERDIIGMDVASVSYGMLLTLGLSVGHGDCVRYAMRGLEECPPLVVRLTDLLPSIVAEELAEDAPLANPAAVQIAYAKIREAWRNS